MLSVDILSVVRNGAAAAMRTLATSIPPIGSIDSPLSSFVSPPLFHSTLKTFIVYNKILPTAAFPFLLQGFPGLLTDTSEHIRLKQLQGSFFRTCNSW